jgi:cytochrome P450
MSMNTDLASPVKTPPIYGGAGGRANLARFRQQPLSFLRDMGKGGAEVSFRLGWFRCALVTQPDGIGQVFLSDMTRESPGFRRIQRTVGEGLLTMTGAAHRDRRLMQPIFSHQHVQQWGESIVQLTAQMLDSWQPEEERDIEAEMLDLTFRILGRVLFGMALERNQLQVAFAELNRYINQRAGHFPLPTMIPTPANRRFRQAQRTLDQEIESLIDLHQQEPTRYAAPYRGRRFATKCAPSLPLDMKRPPAS